MTAKQANLPQPSAKYSVNRRRSERYLGNIYD